MRLDPRPCPDKVKKSFPISNPPFCAPTWVGVKVSGTLKLRPVVKVVGKVMGLVSVNEAPPPGGLEVLTELMVPVALPVLVTCTMRLLVLPMFAPGNVMVPPGATVVEVDPTMYLYEKADLIPLPVKLTVAVAPP